MPQYAPSATPLQVAAGASDRMRSACKGAGKAASRPLWPAKCANYSSAGSLKCRSRSYDHAIASRFPPVLAVYLENAFWNGLDWFIFRKTRLR
jgi:hypothetical protein